MMPRTRHIRVRRLKDGLQLADGNAVMTRAPEPSRQRSRRSLVPVVVTAAFAIGALLIQPVAPAAATAGDEAAFVAALNQVRSDNGLPPLTVNIELANLARGHAQEMADAGEIFHADPISAGFGGSWSRLGENVGVGADVSILVDAFVASPGHFANIIDPGFTQIGVGVVWKGATLYTTHRFLQTADATPTTTAAAPPPTSPPTIPTPPVPPPAPTTTLPPFPAPAISAARVIELFEMLEQVGT